MALQGSLKQLRMGDVIQTIVGNAQSGILRVRQGGQRAVLQLAPGSLRLLEPAALAEDAILDAFVQRGVVGADAAARARAEAGSGDSALRRLRARNVIPDAVLRRLLEEAIEDGVLELFGWTEGEFRFDEGAEPPPMTMVTETSVDPAALLLRAAKRLEERHEVEAVLGRGASLLHPSGGPPPPPPEGTEDPAPLVLSHVDGTNLLDEIALRSGIGLFATRQAAARLVEAGLVRLPKPAEIAAEAEARERAGEVHAALGLYRQWQALDPRDPAPLAAVATIAGRSGRYEDEAEALKAVGRVHLDRVEPERAREAFGRLLAKRPGDRDALDGLREAARALSDTGGFATATRQLAEQSMESGETAQASVLLHDLLSAVPDDVSGRVLRARALVRLADRSQAIEELEKVAALLPPVCRVRADMDSARQAREILLQVAPERSDLLRRFRSMVEGRRSVQAKVAIVLALLGIVGAGGYVLWPPSPRSLLAKAQNAADLGDATSAMNFITELSERFPEAPETAEAMEIRNRIVAEAKRRERPQLNPQVYDDVAARAAKVMDGFTRWPEPAAVGTARELVTLLDSPDGDLLRKAISPAFKDAFVIAASRTRVAALERRDALDTAAAAEGRSPPGLARLRDLTRDARVALDPDWATHAAEAAKTARRLANALAEPAVSDPVRGIESDVESLLRGIESSKEPMVRLESELLRAEVRDAYDKARVDASRLLAGGRLDEAEELYVRLADLVTRAETFPGKADVAEEIQRRGVRDFVEARRRAMATIRRGLDAAAAAEKAADLQGAAQIYAGLVRDHPFVRFDDIFTIPLRIHSLPAGAEVAVNGRTQGKAPVVIRYGWGSRTVVTLSAPNFDTASVVLKTADEKPTGSLRVPLVPLARWSQPVVGTVEAPPVPIGEDLLVCNRAGRVELRAGATGEILWVQDLKTLEGVRGRPAVLPTAVWVPLVDGRVARVTPLTGALVGMVSLPARPVGDAVALYDTVGIATDHAVVLLAGNGIHAEIPVEGTVTAGIVAAHGAFWTGTAMGGIVRVDPRTRKARVLSLGGPESVIGIAPASAGLLVLTADGQLSLVDAAAASVLWRREGLAEATGAPAEAGGIAAATDRAGRIRLFSAVDGSPAGEVDARSASPKGVIQAGPFLATALDDGRLWVYDPASKTVTVDAPVGADARRPLVHLGHGVVAVPTSAGISVIDLLAH